MPAPFVILALPRSRTAWLSAWLSDRDRVCLHDALAYAHSRDALLALTAGGNGLAETAGMVLPRVLHDTLPDARYLIVRRDPKHVEASLSHLGVWNSHRVVEEGNRALHDAAAYLRTHAPVREIAYSDLGSFDVLCEVWNFLRGDAHDEDRTRAFMGMRITKINPFAGSIPHDLLAEERTMKLSGGVLA